MRDLKSERLEHARRQEVADIKVHAQHTVVGKLHDCAGDEPTAQQILNEMLHNKATVDMNRAMFDYDSASYVTS